MKHLSSVELLARTKSLVAEERRATVALIEHLEEISRRMLYAEMGYASLWEFATIELGLSEGAAQRRIQAMRLVRDVPSAKALLETGKLSLSNAAKVQSFRQAEKKQGRTRDAQLLVAQVETLSQRDCEKKLYEISPQSMPRERDRIVAATSERELTIVVSPELHDQLQRIKGLLAHTLPNATYADLLQYMATETLTRLEKKKGIAPKETENNKLTQATIAAAADVGCVTGTHAGDKGCLNSTGVLVPSEATKAEARLSAQGWPGTTGEVRKHESPAKVVAKAALPVGQRVYLSATIRREVFGRSGGQCEYTSQGHRCTSRYSLEMDHVQPLALHGSNDIKNLRILCCVHNTQQAREKLG
jgi:5-methylcytosine-specific restriction endonuclease McrA